MMTTFDTECKISKAAHMIAGAVFEDAQGSTADRLRAAISCVNLGSDGDLSHSDREALRILLEYMDGGECDLMDSDTTEPIRAATIDEAIESIGAGPEGHFAVNGRRCYVAI